MLWPTVYSTICNYMTHSGVINRRSVCTCIYWCVCVLNACLGKGKGSPHNLPCRHVGGVEVELCLFFTLALDWGGWSKPRPGRFTPGKAPRYPFNRRVSGPQGRSGRAFESRIVQPVVSRYTDCHIPAPSTCLGLYEFVCSGCVCDVHVVHVGPMCMCR
jgi:hypothetical protein